MPPDSFRRESSSKKIQTQLFFFSVRYCLPSIFHLCSRFNVGNEVSLPCIKDAEVQFWAFRSLLSQKHTTTDGELNGYEAFTEFHLFLVIRDLFVILFRSFYITPAMNAWNYQYLISDYESMKNSPRLSMFSTDTRWSSESKESHVSPQPLATEPMSRLTSSIMTLSCWNSIIL